MNLTNYSLQQDLYNIINTLPVDIKVTNKLSNESQWYIQCISENETVYYPYADEETANQDVSELCKFLQYIYTV